MMKESMLDFLHTYSENKPLPIALITLYAEELYEEYGPEYIPDYVVPFYSSAFLTFSSMIHDYYVPIEDICSFYSINPNAILHRIITTLEDAGYQYISTQKLIVDIAKNILKIENLIRYFIISAADWNAIETNSEILNQSVPGSIDWWIAKSRIHEYYGEWEAAEACILNALFENYTNLPLWRRRMGLYERTRKPIMALRCAQKMKELREM